jgi:autotransporter-associated beta strand protein
MKNRPSKSVSLTANRRSLCRPGSIAIAGLLSALGAISSTNAATETWSGTASSTWDTSALNWNGGAATWTSSNDALFSGNPKNNVTTATGLTIGAITLDNTFIGSVTMSGSNTVGGTTTIGGGTLIDNNATGLGTSAITVNSGGALNLTNLTYANNVSGAGTVNESGTTGDAILSGNWSGFTGTLNLNGSEGLFKTRFTAATQASVISSSATINVNSGTTLYLNQALNYGASINVYGAGNNEYLGALRLETGANQTGAVTLKGNTSIGVNASAATISGAIGDGGGGFGFEKVGNNTLTLSGTNTYTGNTTISNGTVVISGNSTGLTGTITANATTLTLNGNTGSLASNAKVSLNGGTFNYQGATAGSTLDISGYTLGGGDRAFQATYGTSGNTVLNLANATRTAGTENNYNTSGGTNGTTNKITFTSAPTTNALVDKGDYFGGTSYMAYDATNLAARAYNYSTDANGVTAAAGTTFGAVSSSSNVNVTGAISGQTTAQINTLRLGTTSGVTVAASNTLSVDGILKSGGNAATISGGSAIQTTTSGGEMVIRSNASGDTLTISSLIADNGGGSLTSGGAGVVILSNSANTYTGGTTVTAGELRALLPTTPSQTFTPFGTGTVTTTGGTLHFLTNGSSSSTQTFANNFVLNGGTVFSEDGNTILGTSSNTIVVNGATTLQRRWGHVTTKSLQLNGVLSGSAALTIQGNGGATGEGGSVWINNASNTYSGTITVQANTGTGGIAMVVGANNAVQFANINLIGTHNGTDTALNYGVQFASGVTAPVLGSLTGSGNINLADLAGTPANVALTAGSNNSTTTFSGILSGGGGLTKAGTGVMTLSGANTYTGATTVSAGKLSVTGSLANSAVAVSGGTSSTLGGSGTLAGAVTVTNGSRLAPGSVTSSSNFGSFGTLTLSNASGLTLTNANLDFDLSTTGSGATNDKIALGSNALSFSTLNFVFSGTTLDTTTAYTLISTSGSLTAGTLTNITTDFTNVTGGSYLASYNFVNGTGLQVSFTAVPESNAAAFAIIALLGVVVLIRRRNREV